MPSQSLSPRTGIKRAAAILLTAVLTVAPACASSITAALERDGVATSGPAEHACTFCPNQDTSVSVSFSQSNFPVPDIPLTLPGFPAHSQIAGSAFVDLSTGVMRGDAFASASGHNEQHQMRFISRMEETIDINLPLGLPAAERVVEFVGIVHGKGTATNRGMGTIGYILDIHGLRFTASASNLGGWEVNSGENNSAIQITPLAIGYQVRITRAIPNSGVMLIQTQLDGTAWAEGRLDTGVGIANAHALDTALLQMILPQGATYTSSSGVFLTEPYAPTSVPEPQTWSLMLAGIGMIARLRRGRAGSRDPQEPRLPPRAQNG
jgi:hypothetical protein